MPRGQDLIQDESQALRILSEGLTLDNAEQYIDALDYFCKYPHLWFNAETRASIYTALIFSSRNRARPSPTNRLIDTMGIILIRCSLISYIFQQLDVYIGQGYQQDVLVQDMQLRITNEPGYFPHHKIVEEMLKISTVVVED